MSCTAVNCQRGSVTTFDEIGCRRIRRSRNRNSTAVEVLPVRLDGGERYAELAVSMSLARLAISLRSTHRNVWQWTSRPLSSEQPSYRLPDFTGRMGATCFGDIVPDVAVGAKSS